MTNYREWIKNTRIEDIIGGSAPPRGDLDKLTYAEIGQMIGGRIVAAAKAVGIDLTDAELTDIIITLFPVEPWPAFHPSHYDLHS